MMFDKDLFFSLCEKYNIKLCDNLDKPMMEDAGGVHAITGEDVKRIFAPSQIYFDYSTSKIETKIISSEYYVQDDFAIAC